MSKTAGSQQIDYLRRELDAQHRPKELESMPRHESLHPTKLTLPTGPSDKGAIPKDKLN